MYGSDKSETRFALSYWSGVSRTSSRRRRARGFSAAASRFERRHYAGIAPNDITALAAVLHVQRVNKGDEQHQKCRGHWAGEHRLCTNVEDNCFAVHPVSFSANVNPTL